MLLEKKQTGRSLQTYVCQKKVVSDDIISIVINMMMMMMMMTAKDVSLSLSLSRDDTPRSDGFVARQIHGAEEHASPCVAEQGQDGICACYLRQVASVATLVHDCSGENNNVMLA